MANVNPTYINSDGLHQGMADADTLDLGGLAMTGDITLSGGAEISGLPAIPGGDTYAASKAYVDAVVNALPPKESVRVATTAVLSTFVATGSGVGKTLTAPTNASSFNDIDSVTLSLNDRVLVKDGGPNATPAIDNGIYTVTALGNDTDTSFELTRATDLDEDAEMIEGVTVWVGQGTTHQNQRWTIYSNDPLTVDTSANEWTQTGGTSLFTGGDGIDITAGEISVDLASNPGLEFDGGSPNKLRALVTDGLTLGASGIGAVAYNGITVDANGISVNAGDGLVANSGPGDLDIDLATGAVIQPGLQFGTGADAGKLAVLPDPAGAIDVLAAGLHVRTDDSTIQINGSNQLEVINAGDANRLSLEVVAFENVDAGDAVFWGGANNQVQEARAGTGGRKKAVGVMEDTVLATNTGTMVMRGVAVGVLSSATVGQRYFVGAAGGITTTAPSSSGDAVIQAGYAKNADDLDVLIQFIGIRP